MKVGGTRGVGQTSGTTAVSPARPSKRSEAVKTARRVSDSLSIMGLSPAEMSDKVRGAITTLMEEVNTLRGELEAAHQRLAELEQLVDMDPLVPVPNRRAFVREISRLISFAERYGTPSSLVFLDLNDMKELNDTYGHGAGDAALVHVAGLLVKNVRDTDMVGRLGGDEFGLLLVQTEEEEAAEKAESLMQIIAANPMEWEGKQVPVSVAYGAHTFTAGQDASEALAHADARMYEHKRQGKTE